MNFFLGFESNQRNLLDTASCLGAFAVVARGHAETKKLAPYTAGSDRALLSREWLRVGGFREKTHTKERNKSLTTTGTTNRQTKQRKQKQK